MRRGRAAAVALLAVAACGIAQPEVIGREIFVETYVALRVAELRSPDAVISAETRERVLAEQGVTEDELLAFAEAHGGDLAFMQTVWIEVESRLDDLRSRPDSVG